MDKFVYGITIASDVHQHSKENDLYLGVVVLETDKSTLNYVKEEIKTQVKNLPVAFRFITEQGFYITESQECLLNLRTIITKDEHIRLKHVYEKPRIGIQRFYKPAIFSHTGNWEPIGFILMDYKASLRELKQRIIELLTKLQMLKQDQEFNLLDRNGWPINNDQEYLFNVIDLLVNNCVKIVTNSDQICQRNNQAIDSIDGKNLYKVAPTNSNYCAPPLLSRQPTFIYKKEPSSSNWYETTKKSFEAKQVLLSYVRNEASEHAACVKHELIKMGYSVFLDVDEIKSGCDWQDSLNAAIAKCQVFVPLITPRYGETLWTNREVKLADVLGKFILPISFLKEWPPKVLAIQFATTQYIPWKPQQIQERQEHTGELDIKSWEVLFLKDVVTQISDRLKEQFDGTYFDGSSTRSRMKGKPPLRSCPTQLPDGFEELSQNRAGRPLIVISVHPQQKDFVARLKYHLGLFYDVRCSVEIEKDDNDSQGSDAQLFSQEEGTAVYSQVSEMSSSSDCDAINRNLHFQENADEAGVILMVLSKAFARSKTCKQQVFYCEQRKKIIPIKYEEFCMPGWLSMLIGTGTMEDANIPNFYELLGERIEKYLKMSTEEDLEKNESMLLQKAQTLKLQMPSDVGFVFIAGGTQFYNEESKNICKSIGAHLASTDIHLVTGGFQGVGQTVATSYVEHKHQLGKEETVWHILPNSDPKEIVKGAPQLQDRTFQSLPYGTTLFSGESVRERENVISRLFDICILVEGGPGAAHEAEQFAWNDHVVIPVKCTGGAAGGKFNVPERIFQLPYGVEKVDWDILQRNSSTAEDIGKAVAKIVHSLTQRFIGQKLKTSNVAPNNLKCSDSGLNVSTFSSMDAAVNHVYSSIEDTSQSTLNDIVQFEGSQLVHVSSNSMMMDETNKEHLNQVQMGDNQFTDIRINRNKSTSKENHISLKEQIERGDSLSKHKLDRQRDKHGTKKAINHSVSKMQNKCTDTSPTVDALARRDSAAITSPQKPGSKRKVELEQLPQKKQLLRPDEVQKRNNQKTKAAMSGKTVFGSPKKRTRQTVINTFAEGNTSMMPVTESGNVTLLKSRNLNTDSKGKADDNSGKVRREVQL